MARRRMIDTNMVKSYAFTEMRSMAQALYLQLVANADDDGVSEARMCRRMINARPNALQELAQNNFVTLIEPDGEVVYLNEWQRFNKISPKRGQPSRFRNTLREQLQDIEFVEFSGFDGDKCSPSTEQYSTDQGIQDQNIDIESTEQTEFARGYPSPTEFHNMVYKYNIMATAEEEAFFLAEMRKSDWRDYSGNPVGNIGGFFRTWLKKHREESE